MIGQSSPTKRGQNLADRQSYVIRGGTFIFPDRAVEDGCLFIVDGRIQHFQPSDGSGNAGRIPDSLPVVNATGKCVTPGFMEMHIHGAGGIGFDSVRGGGDILKVRDFLLKRGITGFLPTLLCDESALVALVDAIEESGLPESVIPGIYIEGPFVNPKRRGGIPENLIRPADPDYLRHILDITRGKLKIMTLAPELPGAEKLYPVLEDAGVMISLGHSDCNPSTAPLPSGDYSITHLFNAMSGVSHKDAGLANLAFSDSRPFVELNADSVHVNRECMRLVAGSIAPGRLVLTSDAVVAAGLAAGPYRYFGHTIVSGPKGVRYEKTDILMGSNRLGPEILRSWLDATGSPQWSSILALTATPARVTRTSHLRGSLMPGMPADIILWDTDFTSPRLPVAL